ncbi:fungal specific transcription factor domain-containing protein [Aspergillus ibericus CBS 121593]|uniref:Xylanolytic transcriptional activator regulatory domain-containing protein n=1 Tax=Aspergillus ibericus CBS 121593 TaxID=1448316 RepID=A0A395GK55_9EURO|nr:hypothetical protein BO80DRAFT_497463 [Aspergillus ibericus CBS 121593]RAK95849.1 hypothetical protein BO80DRAFT_497463 [Aspergillus ibericus CBS 121593]
MPLTNLFKILSLRTTYSLAGPVGRSGHTLGKMPSEFRGSSRRGNFAPAARPKQSALEWVKSRVSTRRLLWWIALLNSIGCVLVGVTILYDWWYLSPHSSRADLLRRWGVFEHRLLDNKCYRQDRTATLLSIFTGPACVACQRSGILCVSNYQRKTRLHGSVETIRDRIQCLEAIVKGSFPGAPLDSIPVLLQFGRNAGYPIPRLSTEPHDDIEHCADKSSQPMPRLVKDSRGHSHYIGPSGSFCFFADLRSLISERQPSSRFATDTVAEALEVQYHQSRWTLSGVNSYLEEDTRVQEQRLSGHSCREFPETPFKIDNGWTACVHTALAFACWISDDSIRDHITDLDMLRSRCWTLAREALPNLLTSSTVSNIQALLLMAILLHNNNDRNAAWTLTGGAARLAIALGLHRSDVNNSLRLIEREIRDRVWYVLFSFEQFLCLSLGRPSAIDCPEVALEPACEDLSGSNWAPPQYVQVAVDLQRRASRLRDAICFVHRPSFPVLSADSPVADPITLLGSLKTWESTMPTYLTVPVHILHACPTPCVADLDTFISRCPPSHLRPMVLLHMNYNNLIIQLTRPYLLTVISANRGPNPRQYYPWTTPDNDLKSLGRVTEYLARTCLTSASRIINLLVLLESTRAINGKSGLDLFYGYSAGMVLLLRRLWVLPPHPSRQTEELEGTTQSQVQSMVARLQSVMEVHAKCSTMQRFKAVLQKFDEAVMANARSGAENPSSDNHCPLTPTDNESHTRILDAHILCPSDQDGDPDASISGSLSAWQESMQAVTQYSLDWSNFEQFLGSLNLA